MQLNFSTLPSPPSEPQDQETQHPLDDSYVQLQAEEEDVQRQQACLQVWNSLQREIQQLHELFTEFNKVVHVNIILSLCKRVL